LDFKKKGNKMRRIGFQPNGLDAQNKSYDLSPKNDFSHTLIMGATGSGKTVSLILPMIDERIKLGYGMLVYAYKGHEHKRVKYLAKEAGCLDRVMEIGKPHGCYLNLLSFLDENGVKKAISSLCGNNIYSNGDYFTEAAAKLGYSVVDILRKINYFVQCFMEEFNRGDTILNVTITEITDEFNKSIRQYNYPQCDSSFRIIADITKSSRGLKDFFLGLEEVVAKAEKLLDNLVHRYYKQPDRYNSLKISAQKVAATILHLKNSAKQYKDFSIELSGNESSGNNGVLFFLTEN